MTAEHNRFHQLPTRNLEQIMNEQHITNPSQGPTLGNRRTPLGRRASLALGVSAGLIGGAAVGLTLGIPGMTSAASPDAAAAADLAVPAVVAQADETTDDAATDVDRTARMTERIRESLDTLVDDGTIDASQADAVAAHLAAQAPDRGGPGGHGGSGGHGGPGEGRPGRGGGMLGSGVLTELLGLERSEIAEQLRDGSTLAEIAEANGVTSQELVDALVAESTERVDAAVEAGRLDADDAAEKLAEITERVTERIEQSNAD